MLGDMIATTVIGSFFAVAFGITLGMAAGEWFTDKAERLWGEEKKRRADDFMGLGMAPACAYARAEKEMAKEADDALQEDGK